MVLVICLQMNDKVLDGTDAVTGRSSSALFVINVIIPTQLNISLDIGVHIAFHLNIYSICSLLLLFVCYRFCQTK